LIDFVVDVVVNKNDDNNTTTDNKEMVSTLMWCYCFISSSCSVGERGRKEPKKTTMEAKNVDRRG
jgi:hypothetical protein